MDTKKRTFKIDVQGGAHHGKKRRQYSSEFRQEAVRLFGSGNLPASQRVGVKYVCIEKNSGHFQVTMMCRLLGVSLSEFYARRRRLDSLRAIHNRPLVIKIKAIFSKYRQSYGSPRILRELLTIEETASLGQVCA